MRKTARGRKTRLRRLLSEQPDFLEKAASKQTLSFRFSGEVSRSEKIIAANHLSKGFGDLVLFKDLSFTLPRGGRLAITGPNGSGKSTLLKILMGEISADDGWAEKGEHLVYGYLDQQAQTLHPEKTVLEEASVVRPEMTPEELRSKLAAFLFRGDQVFQKTETLSGGQRNRLMLCKIVLSSPDVLILDEPTNHLDIESCETFENALEEYEGSVIAVSHDRYFIDHIFDELLILGLNEEGQKCIGLSGWVQRISDDRGVFSQWNDKIAARTEELKKIDTSGPIPASKSVSNKKPAVKVPPELRPFNALSIEDLESRILLLEEEVSVLTEQYGQEQVYKNPALFKELQDKLDTKQAELLIIYRAYEWRLKKK